MTPKTMLESDLVTANVTVMDILRGEHPAIIAAEVAVNSQSGERTITQKLPVRDAVLFGRLLGEVRIGDKISAEIVTEWYEDDYATYLADYSLITSKVTAPTPLASVS